MDINNFLNTIEKNKDDFTLNLFLENGFGVDVMYSLLSEMYERGVIADKSEVGHFYLCSDMNKAAEVVYVVSSESDSLLKDAFASGDATLNIRLENRSHTGFERSVLSRETPLEIINSIECDEQENIDRIFIDPYDLFSFDKHEHVVDTRHSSFLLETGDNLIKLDFNTPLSAVPELKELFYAKETPRFIVAIACVHNDVDYE